jgi:hypothetical protein
MTGYGPGGHGPRPVEPWPDEGLELEVTHTTRTAIDRFSRDIWLLSTADEQGS